jgi:hypothetical protein
MSMPPILKSMPHAIRAEATGLANADEVQNRSWGVFGKAVASMDGTDWRLRIVASSFAPGRRQPETPPKVSDAQ